MLINNTKIRCLLAFALIFWGINSATACKYNVRETGFVDLESRVYSLFVFVDSSVSEQEKSELGQVSRGILEDSNIQYELVDVDRQSNHPALKYFKKNDSSIPSNALISPDGQTMSVPMNDFKTELAKIIFSPKRDDIVKRAIKNYAVLLFVEGQDETQNKQALEIVQSAAKHVSGKMDMMPKPIEHPPVIVTIKQTDLPKETILLWGLGLDVSQITEPHVAIIYGKARWLGPLVSGEQLTKSNLVDLLLVIGADCECGLDKTWLQGTMLPIKWDLPLQKQVAENLGFDAENPYVRMEMMAIMRNTVVSPGTIPLHEFPAVSAGLDSLIESNNNYQNESTNNLDVTTEKSPMRKSFQFVLLFLGVVIGGGLTFMIVQIRKNQTN